MSNQRLNVIQIQTALLIPVTAKFIENKLGVPPAEKDKRAVFWKAEDYATICDRLVHWINTQRGVNASALSGDRPKKDDEPAASSNDGFDFGDEPKTETAATDNDGFDFGGDAKEEDATEGFF